MDECKAVLERIALSLDKIEKAQVFIVASLAQIRNLLGGD